MESSGCFEGFLVDLGEESYATLRGFLDDQSPKELLSPSGLSSFDLQRLNQNSRGAWEGLVANACAGVRALQVSLRKFPGQAS